MEDGIAFLIRCENRAKERIEEESVATKKIVEQSKMDAARILVGEREKISQEVEEIREKNKENARLLEIQLEEELKIVKMQLEQANLDEIVMRIVDEIVNKKKE